MWRGEQNALYHARNNFTDHITWWLFSDQHYHKYLCSSCCCYFSTISNQWWKW